MQISSVFGNGRERRRRTLVAIVCSVCALTAATARASDPGYALELARDGKTEYRIVIGTDASAQVKAVAADLAEHFQAMTGAAIAIGTDEADRVEKQILIGPSTHVSELMTGIDLSRLENEEYLITTVDDSLILTGGERRGTPNAVYTFLDEILGCRWFAPECTLIPSKPTLRVASIYWKRKPAFLFRSVDMSQAARSGWSARVRLNGFRVPVCYARHLVRLTEADIVHETGVRPERLDYPRMWSKFLSDPRLDGSWIPAVGDETKSPWTPPLDVHTLHPKIREDNIGEGLLTTADRTERPEYFALVDGERKSQGRVQPCYSHPTLHEVVAARAREWLKRNPKATYISVSQADFDTYCECDSCTALAATFTFTANRRTNGRPTRPEWGDFSPRSGPVLHFVNKVARELAKDYPDLLVYTLSYNKTLYPPDGIEIEPNVVVQYACWSPCCYYHTYRSCRLNEGMFGNWNNLQRWTELASHVWVWWYDHYASQRFHPTPMLTNWTTHLQELRDLGVEGVYNFAFRNYLDEEWMQPLRAYVYAKTLWNPDHDTWDVIADFAQGYYGPAAEPMLEYIRQTQDLAFYQEGTPQPFMRKYYKEHPHHPRVFHQSAGPSAYVKPDTVRQWQSLFDQAEATAAGDEAVLQRIAIDRLAVDCTAVLYLKPRDPLREQARERLTRVLARVFGDDFRLECTDGKRRLLEEASVFFESSDALTLEQ